MAEKEFRTKADEAYYRLRRMLEAGEFDAGRRLTELGAAEMLGIGRTSVREAIHWLEAEGLLQLRDSRRHRRIDYLEDADPEQVLARYEVREAIQPQAARLAARNMSRKQTDCLLSLARRAIARRDSSDVDDRTDAKRAFLDFLLTNCGNRSLYRIWETHHLSPYLPRDRKLEEKIVGRMNGEAAQYSVLSLAEAIAAGDQDEAERISRAGIREITEALRQTFVGDGSTVSAQAPTATTTD